MPMLWKDTGNDWWVSHVVVSLCLFTGTKAAFVSIQAYRFGGEMISGKKPEAPIAPNYLQKVGAKLPEGGDRIDLETLVKGCRQAPVPSVVGSL